MLPTCQELADHQGCQRLPLPCMGRRPWVSLGWATWASPCNTMLGLMTEAHPVEEMKSVCSTTRCDLNPRICLSLHCLFCLLAPQLHCTGLPGSLTALICFMIPNPPCTFIVTAKKKKSTLRFRQIYASPRRIFLDLCACLALLLSFFLIGWERVL